MTSARPTYEPATEVRPSPGRGQGCFATRKIDKHTVFMIDEPLVTFGANEGILAMVKKVNALPAAAKATWDSLAATDLAATDSNNNLSEQLRALSVSPERMSECVRVAAVVQGNGFAARESSGGSPEEQRAAHRRTVFPNVSRINHSCTPNAHAHFRAAWGAMVLHALRDIEPDEEIFISYINITEPRQARQNRLKAWGFECARDVCEPGPRRDEHETLIVLLQVAMRLGTNTMGLAYGSPPGNPQVERSAGISVQKLRTTLAALDQPDKSHFKPALPSMYNLLGTIDTVAPQDDEADTEALECFRKALMHETHITGKDSPNSIKHRDMLRDRRRLQRQMDEEA